MPNEIIQNLRRIIDEKHQRAIDALGTIAAYLEDAPLPANGSVAGVERVMQPVRNEIGSAHGRPVPRLERKSIRSTVLECITGQYATVDEILLNCPGVTKRQVWGVLTAPDLKDVILRGTDGPETAYRYRKPEA
jgi:hypothetical protein